MQSPRREPFASPANKKLPERLWNSFMSSFYTLYSLLTFFSILFGVVYVLYYSYYDLNLLRMIVGIIVTLFMVYLNVKAPK